MTALDRSVAGSEVIQDLVYLLTETKDGGRAKAAVSRYLRKLRQSCPTPGCQHDLSHAAFVCNGYATDLLLLSPQEGNPAVTRERARPLTVQVVCKAFSGVDLPERMTCRYCLAGGFTYRNTLDGVFCHGCGFFIDFSTRRIGYAREWTIAHLPVPAPPEFRLDSPQQCKTCQRAGAEYKFGDFYFCSPSCLQKYFQPDSS